MNADTMRLIRAWLRADYGRSLRVDYFPDGAKGYRWAVVGITRHNGRWVKSQVSGPNVEAAMDRFAKSLRGGEA